MHSCQPPIQLVQVNASIAACGCGSQPQAEVDSEDSSSSQGARSLRGSKSGGSRSWVKTCVSESSTQGPSSTACPFPSDFCRSDAMSTWRPLLSAPDVVPPGARLLPVGVVLQHLTDCGEEVQHLHTTSQAVTWQCCLHTGSAGASAIVCTSYTNCCMFRGCWMHLVLWACHAAAPCLLV